MVVPRAEDLRVTEVFEVSISDNSLGDSSQFRLPTTTRGLKSSLQHEGQRKPVDLTGTKPHKTIDGPRRIESFRQLGRPNVKAFVRSRVPSDEAQRLAFRKIVDRNSHWPLKKGNAIQRARKRGRPLDESASDLGISVKHVRRYKDLHYLPVVIRNLVDRSAVPTLHTKILYDHGIRSFDKWIEVIKPRNSHATNSYVNCERRLTL